MATGGVGLSHPACNGGVVTHARRGSAGTTQRGFCLFPIGRPSPFWRASSWPILDPRAPYLGLQVTSSERPAEHSANRYPPCPPVDHRRSRDSRLVRELPLP